jgi:hypothetical protein
MSAPDFGIAELDVYPADWILPDRRPPFPRACFDEGRGGDVDQFAPGGADEWSPFVSTGGQTLRVACSLEPIVELKSLSRIGFRMTRRILMASDVELAPSAVAKLSVSDILRIDLATIERGLGRLHAMGAGERTPSVIIPVTYSSLSRRRGRAAIAAALERAGQLVQHGVICEVRGVKVYRRRLCAPPCR